MITGADGRSLLPGGGGGQKSLPGRSDDVAASQRIVG